MQKRCVYSRTQFRISDCTLTPCQPYKITSGQKQLYEEAEEDTEEKRRRRSMFTVEHSFLCLDIASKYFHHPAVTYT